MSSNISATTSASAPANPVQPGADVARSKNWPWYKSSIGFRLTPTCRQLFEEYSHIAPSDVEPHIFYIRDLAWEIFPWPCIGEFWFVSFGLSMHPQYQSLLDRLTTPSRTPMRLLDLGTCVGQDLRKLLFDGAPMDSLFGSDIFPAYESVGQALFKDAETFKNRFIAGDLFDQSSESALAQTEGTWDVIVIIMFLHVFNWKDQVKACGRILNLLSTKPGCIIIGAQTATTKPGEQNLVPPFVKPGEQKSVFRQSRETFTQMWEGVGKDKGIPLKIWAEYEAVQPKVEGGTKEEKFFTGDEQRRLFFVVERA